jgi:cyclopropane-fatty-acyl-phospholipid synthase
MLGLALAAAEKGYLPDPLIRFGIRSLLNQRIKSFDKSESARFVNGLSSSPIAIETDVANSQHYEVPSSFFDLALGKNRKYSSCYWDRATTLDDAETEMLELTAKRAEISDEMKVLDLGCGWGSFLLFAAEKFPNSEFTGVSNSSTQKEHILEQAKKRSLSNVKVITADMNDFQPGESFDRIVSIEMFEHMRNYQVLFERLSSWLKENGKFFLHIFTHREFTYPFETEGEDNWMGRYFFSGGMMPAHSLPNQFQRALKIENSWKVSGTHYAKTCEAWLANHDKNEEHILEIFKNTYGMKSAQWFNRWRIFFLSCAELFAFNRGEEWFVSHYLFSKRNYNA